MLAPWGGNGGHEWDDVVHNGVKEITLVYGRCIHSIQLTYDNNGKHFLAEKHGGIGGTKSAQIKLQFLDEILISVNGHYCPVVYGGSPVIRSLTFKTNKRILGPFGVEEGTPFNFMTNGGHIVGNSETAVHLRSENHRKLSPEKEVSTTRGSSSAAACKPTLFPADGGVGDQKVKHVWPKLYIALTSKEKEEDFMAMKGCKPSHRPKKRPKLIQRSLLVRHHLHHHW
ncbi:hypothetical protein R6Q59_010406 [Mikania micrantha]